MPLVLNQTPSLLVDGVTLKGRADTSVAVLQQSLGFAILMDMHTASKSAKS